jgi:MerR family transcriptional regulator, redox-sensitive transcriptional activator SoxR
MPPLAELMTIGELARRAGRSPSAIRYYEQIGLLPEPARLYGQRRYDSDAPRKLAVIDAAQRAGLALDEIRALLDAASGSDSAAVEELRKVAERKLPELTAMIERSLIVHEWLTAAARCECPSLYECALFDDPAARREQALRPPSRERVRATADRSRAPRRR